jgi:hypothetical protein
VTARLLATTDFIASFHPQDTSYGSLPGGNALRRTVDELRAGAPTAWIDTGDLAQGNPVGAVGGTHFVPVGALSIDLAVVGNHDLDWGVDHFHRHGATLGFPWLAANADYGVPGTHVLELDGRRIGVVGVTHPLMHTMHPEYPADADVVGVVRARAASLRAEGCATVVLAMHDGIDRVGAGTDDTRIAELCARLRGHVDLVLGGHTLERHAGALGGVPYLQPWPFGTQVGVADLHEDGTVEVSTVDVTGSGRWTGPGADELAGLDAEIIGHLAAPLTNTLGGAAELSVAIADALLDLAPGVDAALVSDLWTQAPRDGVLAQLPAGPVTRAQVHRATPLTGGATAWGGQLLTTRLPLRDLDAVVAALPDNGRHLALRPGAEGEVRVVLPAFHAHRFGLRHDQAPECMTWRDALIHHLRPRGAA